MTTQAAFRAALLDAQADVPAGLTDGAGAPAGRRYAVYRNNVAVSLTEALRTGFPVIRKLLGDENFDHIAGVYLRAHPPSSPLMMHYGQQMPEFLAGFAPLEHLGYLADMARLELALRASYHAADAPPLDGARLAGLPAEDLVRIRLRFAPAVRLIPSPWPLFDIWRFNQEPGAPKPKAGAQSVLVIRPEFDPQPLPLSPAEAEATRLLIDGQTLEHAVAAGTAEAPDFDIGALLTHLLTARALTDFDI